jgi:Protein of unknown function (DUF2523)
MGSLFAFLAAAVGPLAVRALVAVGFASVSFAGVTAAYAGLQTYAVGAWAALPAAVIQLAGICGVPMGLGIILGAGAARVGLWVAANGLKLVFKGV